MKKNKMMRLASVLLIAVMLTTCVISGTFAKYVTSDEVSDSARVAKFGVAVTGSGNLFDQNYIATSEDEGDTGYAGFDNGDQDVEDHAFLTVETSNGDKLVAPGTKNDSGLTIDITGTPEVDVTVKFDLTINDEIFLKGKTGYPDLTKGAYLDNSGAMTSDAKFNFTGTYYPVRFTLAGSLVEEYMDEIKAAFNRKANVNYTDDSVTGTLSDIQTALEAINDEIAYVDANTNLSTIGLGEGALQLTWEWEFEGATVNRVVWGNTGIQYASAAQVDKMDTLLGDLAAGDVADVDDDQYSLNVDIALSATVTQVD